MILILILILMRKEINSLQEKVLHQGFPLSSFNLKILVEVIFCSSNLIIFNSFSECADTDETF